MEALTYFIELAENCKKSTEDAKADISDRVMPHLRGHCETTPMTGLGTTVVI